MGEEFSFFDLKRMHSSNLGPPAGSAPAQRFVHTPSTSSPELWSAAARPAHPGRGKAPNTASTQSVNLSRMPSVSTWERGWQCWGPPLKSEKGGGICCKNRTVKHRGEKAEKLYMEIGYMAYIGTLQDPSPATSTPAGLCSLDFQWLNSGKFFTEYCHGKNITIPITLNINLMLYTIWNNKGKNAVSTHWTFRHSFASGKLALVQISEMLPLGHQSHRMRLLCTCF